MRLLIDCDRRHNGLRASRGRVWSIDLDHGRSDIEHVTVLQRRVNMLSSRHGVLPIVLRPDEVAVLLGCSSWTIRRLIRLGRLRAVRMGRRYLVRVDDLVAFLESSPQASDVELKVPDDLPGIEPKPRTT